MALPLKSGADLYNNQALRMRLHNLGADPTEVGAGLIYFNTSTGLNTSQKARLYTGSAWKTIAFSEDLDVASNADFLALKDRVDLLSGDVDTDAIISNMKEVSEFLEGFNEDASLMDYLNTELGKKLDKTGGTITFSGLYGLTLARTSNNTNFIHFTGGDKDFGFLGFAGVGNPIYADYNGVSYTLLHSGNYSDYALPKSGGTIASSAVSPLCIDTTHASANYITFLSSGIAKSYVGWNPNLGAFLQNENDQFHIINGNAKLNDNTLLHSGNVGDYALKTNGSNAITGSLNFRTDTALYRFANNSSGCPSWYNGSAWKTIAFTDSDITGNAATANKLITSSGADAIVPTTSGHSLVYGDLWVWAQDASDRFVRLRNSLSDLYTRLKTDGSGEIFVSGNHALKLGTANTTRMLINSSGNVTIGGSDLAGTDYKLYVNQGKSLFYAWNNTTMSLGTPPSNSLLVGLDVGLGMWYQSGVGSVLQSERFDGTATAYNLNLQPLGGNVLIGTTEDNGAKLQVNGKAKFISDANGLNLYTRINGVGIQVGRTTANYTGGYNGGLSYGEDETILGYVAGVFNDKDANNTHFFYGGPAGSAVLNIKKGNVGIGTSNPTEKLHVVGNLRVTGNIIADGEVSAGGAAEEGGNAGGGGAFHSESIAVGATQTTIAHGLGTDDIVVSIYEKDGVSGRWSIILTDVEIVDANNIIVSFGSATTVEHKVVIMGAVA